MQKRYLDRGAPVTSDRIDAITQALFYPVVLSGGEIEIADTALKRFRVLPIKIVLPSGIILYEDVSKIMDITTAGNFTLVYTHVSENILGGTGAKMEMLDGLIEQGDSVLANSTIIAWIVYPSSAAPLTLEHFILPPKLRFGAPSTVWDSAQITLPPLTVNTSDANSKSFITKRLGDPFEIYSEPDINHNPDGQPVTVYKFTTAQSGSLTVRFPFIVKNKPISKVIIKSQVDADSGVAVRGIDSEGNTIALTPGALTPSSVYKVFTMYLKRDPAFYPINFAPGDLFTVELAMTFPNISSNIERLVRIKYIAVSEDTAPIEG